MDKLDAIFYINLAHRTDRREQMETMLRDYGIKAEKITRIDAIYKPENGVHGCVLSHICALQAFLANPHLQTCLVLEDDFCFTSSATQVEARLTALFISSLDWEVVSLAYNPRGAGLCATGIDGFVKVLHHGTTSGYLLRRAFAPALLTNFQESEALMAKHGRNHSNCLDVYWYRLQERSKWYAFSPALGFQRDGYSDIEKAHVSYNC